MRILFIGYSNVIKRRILPFLSELDSVESVDIAKFEAQHDEKIDQFGIAGRVFNSYEEGIQSSNADIAYISTVNSAHAEWAEKALKKGMNVIVDKPAFMSETKAVEMVDMARKKNLGIAEATVYSYHSQIEKVLEIIAERNLAPINLTVNFSFPPMSSDDFRYRKELGGGALNDLGPYVVSAGRIFFNELPENVLCSITRYDYKNQIETSFSVLNQYSKGRTLIGNFGFNSEYINRLNVFGENFYFELNRVFTPPADQENEIIFKTNNSINIIKTDKSNCFISFIKEYIDSIKRNEYSYFYSKLLSDAKAIELLKSNILKRNI